MQIRVNDEPLDRPEGETVAALLQHLNLHRAPCAVEVNQALVSKRQHDQHQLKDGDVVEVVTLVGGG